MNKLSVVIVTKNEEANIERCLNSVSWADEIVVVDSYSEDNTIQICEKYNCKIIQTEWKGFGKTKKFAVENSSYDWVLSIDADEEVSNELQKKIKEILNNPKFAGYFIKRKSFYLGKEVNYCGWNKDFPLRLFNKQNGNFNEKTIHESIVLNGEKTKISEPLFHYTYPTVSSHIKKMNFYSDLQAEKFISKGKRYSILSAIFFGVIKFLNMYFLKLGILDGKVGFIICFNSAIGVYLKYLKTWQRKK